MTNVDKYSALQDWITSNAKSPGYINRSVVRAENDRLIAALRDLQSLAASANTEEIIALFDKLRDEIRSTDLNDWETDPVCSD